MNCDNCYYKKLCDRAGVTFKDDGHGKCFRLSYYNPKAYSKEKQRELDECLSSLSTARGAIARDDHIGIGVGSCARYPYDASNAYDMDAQEKPSPNVAPFSKVEENRRRINARIDAQIRNEKKGKKK